MPGNNKVLEISNGGIDYDSDSPTEESRRFRRELLERVRTQLFATAEREPGPVEQRLLRQVASIIQRCETELLESFYAPPSTQPQSLPPSRRGSAFGTSAAQTPPRTGPRAHSGYAALPPDQAVLPEPRSPPGNAILQELGAPPAESTVWDQLPIDFLDWPLVFPPGPEMQGAEREDSFMTLNPPPVWTR